MYKTEIIVQFEDLIYVMFRIIENVISGDKGIESRICDYGYIISRLEEI